MRPIKSYGSSNKAVFLNPVIKKMKGCQFFIFIPDIKLSEPVRETSLYLSCSNNKSKKLYCRNILVIVILFKFILLVKLVPSFYIVRLNVKESPCYQ